VQPDNRLSQCNVNQYNDLEIELHVINDHLPSFLSFGCLISPFTHLSPVRIIVFPDAWWGIVHTFAMG
jgi:hypothetical protein